MWLFFKKLENMNDIYLGIKPKILLTNEDWITLQTIKKIEL